MLHTEIHPSPRRNTFRFRPAINRSTIPLRSPPVSNTLSQLENNLMYQTTAAYIINILRRGENNQLLFNEFEDVEVIPTPTQIAHATQIIECDSSVNYANSSCPITLDYFEDGELICMIRHCKHIFKRPAITEWFTRNVRCPLCRYDIRDYVEENTDENDEESECIEETKEDENQEEDDDIINPFSNHEDPNDHEDDEDDEDDEDESQYLSLPNQQFISTIPNGIVFPSQTLSSRETLTQNVINSLQNLITTEMNRFAEDMNIFPRITNLDVDISYNQYNQYTN